MMRRSYVLFRFLDHFLVRFGRLKLRTLTMVLVFLRSYMGFLNMIYDLMFETGLIDLLWVLTGEFEMDY